MGKFLVKFETYLVLESKLHNTFEDIDNSFDIGSRCWESEIVDQLATEEKDAEAMSMCNLGYRSRMTAVAQLPDDHESLPDRCDICIKENMC